MNKLAQRARGIHQSNIRAVTRRIEAIGGVNLGQGTCDLPTDPKILQAAHVAIDSGHNSYTLFDGIVPLKEALVERYKAYNNLTIKPNNVLVTGGATGALECICKCFLEPGDEVILFEPIYQYHVSLVVERGAVPRFVSLHSPDWSFSLDDLESSFSDKTKLFVFANPNNPCGKVFTREELTAIGDACRRHEVIAVTDEVYEYILADGAKHITLASLPGMFEHSLTLSSASKTLFVTGWRVGWLIGPEEIMEPLGVKSDETYVCAPAPFQHAVAYALGLGDAFFDNIRIPFQKRRNKLSDALNEAGLRPLNPEGAYYTLADYTSLGFKDDLQAMNGLIDQVGVGSVSGRAFFPSKETTGLLRFCFAVTDEVLDQGCKMLTSKSIHVT
ncbi:MAG TPA: pyridoxal phosphate-dependent aminotransferase [Pyrinomonadaceae bacterium]|nr:pyridoxal phosphate-dependent aminotransferase [Pyrinomonadaceae bacterium]